MKQIIFTVIMVTAIVGLLAAVVIGSQQKRLVADRTQTSDSALANSEQALVDSEGEILFWGTTCPHCHDTIGWIKQNPIDQQLTITRKEVYENQTNAAEFAERAKSCGIDQRNIGVPLLFTSDGRCLIGTPDITQYLENKIGQLDQDLKESNTNQLEEGRQE